MASRPYLLLPLLSLVACGHTTRPARVAVLPLDRIGRSVKDVSQLDAVIAKQIVDGANIPVVSASAVRSTFHAKAPCRRPGQGSVSCGAAVGASLGATHVVVCAVGGLGKTHVVQLKVIEVKKAAVTRSFEETLFDARTKVEAALVRLTRRAFDRRRPWYKRWWVWSLVAAGAAAAAVGVAVPLAASGPDDKQPYRDYTLP